MEVAGTVPPSEILGARAEGAAERILFPRTREEEQGQRPVATEDRFEAFDCATHSTGWSEWSRYDHPLGPLFLRALCPGREAWMTF